MEGDHYRNQIANAKAVRKAARIRRKMNRYHSKSDILKLIRKRLDGRTQSDLANELGISEQHLSDILHNRRAPGDRAVETLGFKQVMMYESIKD
jgi:hypothetical protein